LEGEVRSATRIHRVHAVTLTGSRIASSKEEVEGEGRQEAISNNKGNSVVEAAVEYVRGGFLIMEAEEIQALEMKRHTKDARNCWSV
jgi:hypothetical protein